MQAKKYVIQFNQSRRENKQKGKKMKKFVLVCVALISNVAFADYYKTTVSNCDDAYMRAALDKAVVENRSVITVVECDITNDNAKKMHQEPEMHPYVRLRGTCDYSQPATSDVVVRREYFVRETVQQYKPVVTYVPVGAYTRVRPVCQSCDL